MSSTRSLIWDSWNKEHIKKHKVSVAEVEDVYKSTTVSKKSYQNRTLLIGRTNKGRLLTVILSREKQTNPYVVSSRDASSKERRYYEKTNTDKTI